MPPQADQERQGSHRLTKWMIPFQIMRSMQGVLGQRTDQEINLLIGRSTDHPAEADRKIHPSILDQVSETITIVSVVQTAARKAGLASDRNQTAKETHSNQGTTPTRIDSRDNKGMGTMVITPTDSRHEDFQPNSTTAECNICTAQVIFADQNPWDVIHMVRNFINYMKGNPAQRQFFKTNKIVPRRFNTEVNESEIQSSNLEQIQQAVNEDQDLVFDALVATDYINEVNTSSNDGQHSA